MFLNILFQTKTQTK